MTKKDGATERVQAISDVCHGLRHAHTHTLTCGSTHATHPGSASSSQRAQGGESESSRGVQWCEPTLPSWTLGRVQQRQSCSYRAAGACP
jgi:hypothetical protein